MESWTERLGLEGFVLIGIGVCGVLAAWKTDSRAILKEPIERKCWKLIEFDDLVRVIRNNSVQLFDVREREEVQSTGILPTATNIPLGEVQNAFQMTRSEFRENYGVEKPFKEDLNIVTSCYKGGRSKKAMQKLHKLGYIYCRTYGGGFREYSTIKARVQILPTRGIKEHCKINLQDDVDDSATEQDENTEGEKSEEGMASQHDDSAAEASVRETSTTWD